MQTIIQPTLGVQIRQHVTRSTLTRSCAHLPHPHPQATCRDNPHEPLSDRVTLGPAHPAMKLLALDTSTEQLSIAVQSGDRVWCHRGVGGAQASAQLIPAVLTLLAQASLRVSELDALVVGRGPGSFTGLRTACAVVQGLAYGASRPVLGLDTLLALAPPVLAQDPSAQRVLAVLDARMQQVYAAAYEVRSSETPPGADWHTVMPPGLYDPGELTLPTAWREDASVWIAGNASALLGAAPGVLHSPEGTPRRILPCLPDAQALLHLAPAALTRGEAVAAHTLLPLYLRDKVAFTTAERDALKAHAWTSASAPAATLRPTLRQAATP